MYTHNGTRWAKLKRDFKTRCQAVNAPCWICREPINYTCDWRHPDAFQPDHYHPVSLHPQLQYEPTNLRPSHKRCNASRGDKSPANGPWIKAEW